MRLGWPASTALVAACYSPTAQQGAPCNGVTDICPFQQTCQLSGGEYMCTSTTVDAQAPDAVRSDGASASDSGPVPLITVAQATGDDSTAAVNSLGLDDQVQQHDAIIVCFSFPSGHAKVASITDSLENTYSIVVGPVVANGYGHYVAVAADSPAGTDTVTVTLSEAPAADWELLALEYTGLSLTHPFDTDAYDSGNGSAMDSGSASTSSAHELLFAYAHATAPMAGSGFAARDSGDNSLVEDEVVFATGSYGATGTATSGIWTVILATFAGR
jgi:hypothetical protein